MSELHGITVAVDTTGSRVYVGRCHELDDEGILLLDVDVHEDGQDGMTKHAYIQKAAKMGVWKRHDRLSIPRAEIAWIKPLGQIEIED